MTYGLEILSIKSEVHEIKVQKMEGLLYYFLKH